LHFITRLHHNQRGLLFWMQYTYFFQNILFFIFSTFVWIRYLYLVIIQLKYVSTWQTFKYTGVLVSKFILSVLKSAIFSQFHSKVTYFIISFLSYSSSHSGDGFISFVFCSTLKMSAIKHIQTKKTSVFSLFKCYCSTKRL